MVKTNFDIFTKDKQFDAFSEAAVVAERIYQIDASACVSSCGRAMEFAVKWMYSVDASLDKDYKSTLVSLISNEDFRDIVGKDIYKRLDFIRKWRNDSVHNPQKIGKDIAKLCLENLYVFLDFIAYCYGKDYTEGRYDASLLEQQADVLVPEPDYQDIDFDALIEENKRLKNELTDRREKKQQTYVGSPLAESEFETRQKYIDTMLNGAGWILGKNWLNEVTVKGMPNKTGIGKVDYVLYGDDHRPLALIEAKSTCVDIRKGREQAKLYADCLKKQYGRRPVIFLTNGFETRIIDGQYPEREVSEVYSKRDLEKLFNLRRIRESLKSIKVDNDIAGRWYQQSTVKAVCQSFDEKNRRKALIVMATGAGKTRTIIALCKVLLDKGWVKNILFLADRTSLVTQAKRAFVNNLPDLDITNLCEEKDKLTARCVFSTYQTMQNCIDDARDDDGRLFTCGHFDLIICDEAHRSIYNKYKDIFEYFDALLVGLTATPKKDIDKNTYEIFELEDGVPTFGYDLGQAVNDGYLVDFLSVETEVKFIEEGISYDELSDEEKVKYEDTFKNENGELPESIASEKLNTWVFNKDTVRKVLYVLMRDGLKINYGEKLGKTIIFAKNHKHAEFIYDVFNKEYPELKDYAKVIDNQTYNPQNAIDEFSEPEKLPQIAISVDMLDTGIDIPEILNLVFFKEVRSKAKFWQMIGRGTRLCPGLIDGKDKEKFYIFDFGGNFEFFRMNKGKPTANQIALQGALYRLKSQIVYKLQDLNFQTEELKTFRAKLVNELLNKVRELNRDNYAVRQHLRYVEKYSDEQSFLALTYEDTLDMEREIAPFLSPDQDDPKALRFDALIYGIELAHLARKQYKRGLSELYRKAEAVASVSNIPAIMAQSDMLNKILHTDYLESAGINDFEEIRLSLRELIKLIPERGGKEFLTDFNDDILSVEWHESELENDDLKNYKAKAEYYIRHHQDIVAIKKLRTNMPLTQKDIKTLEDILWSEVGTKTEYEAENGHKPLGEFVRELVGMDMNSAKEAFAIYMDKLDSRQVYFVNQIVEYIVHNGLLKDKSVLQESPFTDRGTIVDIFGNDQETFANIMAAIEQINSNASVVVA